jgi:pilus assembly protein CpaB
MKPTSIVLLLVALIAGGLAAFLATQQSGPVRVVDGPTQVIEEAKTQVLVATGPIGVGQRLSGTVVQWRDWPEGAVRPEYITISATPEALTEITGAVARFEIFPGDPIIEQKLVRTGQGYMSAVLDKGKRGISVAVEAASASGGFIMPNDRVDVVSSRAAATGLISETIVRNVKVLAIDLRLGETGTTGAAPDPDKPNTAFQARSIATLELDPQQGEAVINAAQVGTVSLALRSIADFAPGSDDQKSQKSNQNIRLIRFGADTTVVAGQNDAPEVTAASLEEGQSEGPILSGSENE